MVQYFRKLINLFDKNDLNKSKATFKTINIILLMAKPTIKQTDFK